MSLTVIDSRNIFKKDVIGYVRKAQEDSHDMAALTPNGDVFVVCDGMGGHVGGKQASTIAVNSIIEYLKKEKYSDPQQALNEALQFANMQILGYASGHPELKGMGTTACILLLQDTEAYIAHAGDSRIYLYLGKEKTLHRITKDHSFVQFLIDVGQITDEEAEYHPNKNRILKALGVTPDLVPTVGRVIPKNGDIFLICSDGLCGMISDTAIRDVLAMNISLEEKGESLINLALEAGGYDNITLELIQITNSPNTNSEFNDYSPSPVKKSSKVSSKKIRRIVITMLVIVICAIIGFTTNSIVRKQKLNHQIEQPDFEKEKNNTIITVILKKLNNKLGKNDSILEEKISKLKVLYSKVEQNQNEYKHAQYQEAKEKFKKNIDVENNNIEVIRKDSTRIRNNNNFIINIKNLLERTN